MIKISEIAEKANVSTTAVSLALNDKPGVGKETKDRILRIAKENNYIKLAKSAKNPSIRLMRIVRHGHTINSDHDNFLSHYIDNITNAGKLYNCEVQVVSCLIGEAGSKIKSFYSESISGAIIIGTELTAEDIRTLEGNSLPLVFIDTSFSDLSSNFVTMDNFAAVNDILCHLIENNHTAIGLVSSGVEVENFRLRERAFHYFTDRHRNISTFEYTVDSTFEGAYRDFRLVIDNEKSLPTALICVNDIVALGCMKALTEKGIIIPEDISIVGFDNIPQSRMSIPALTTVQVDHSTISRYAMRVLFNKIEETTPANVKIAVGTSLIPRESVKKL